MPDERRPKVATKTRPASRALVPVPKPADEPAPLDDPRIGDVDRWGRSQRMRDIAHRLYDPMYRHWHPVEWDGLDKIPLHGGALLVSNHSGAIPPDAAAIMHGIETELGRPVYGMAEFIFREMPVVGTLWSRLGGITAEQNNGFRLLREDQQLVLVFPEGTKGTGKPYADRYKLARFGRGGFVELAMRAGVPIVPIAVVGAEEAMPVLFKSPLLARALGLPYAPITANMLAMGPLGIGLHFPTKFKLRVLDPVRFDVPPEQARYSRSRVMDASESIRTQIQEALYDMLRHRRSIWTG